jgi:hypothetical protein
MREHDAVVEFPTGRPFRRSGTENRTVADIALQLAASRKKGPRPRLDHPLSVRLRDLTGTADRVVDVLTGLAVDGTLTAACAARLAMRHVAEMERGSSARAPSDGQYRLRHELVVSGEIGGRFAFRIENLPGGAWVAWAALADLELLSGVCPAGVGPVCVILGFDRQGRPRAHLRTPRDWRTMLRSLSIGSVEGNDRHVLVLGGLPIPGGGRKAVISGIADGLRRGGSCAVSSRVAGGWGKDPFGERERRARHHLLLIELAFPGLVDLRGDDR